MRFIITSRSDDTKSPTDGPEFDAELFSSYMRFNEDLQRAGVLIASEGLTPGAPGASVVASGGRRKVVDGPFAESKELVGGFYLIEVPSLDEAKAWALKCPVGMASADILEIRQLTGLDEIPQMFLDLAAKAAPTWTATLLKKET